MWEWLNRLRQRKTRESADIQPKAKEPPGVQPKKDLPGVDRQQADDLLLEGKRRREARAVESIVGDEALTADLSDEPAQVLLDWGIERAKRVADSVAGGDDLVAEEEMAKRLQATRRLIRRVNSWVANYPQLDAQARRDKLTELFEQARVVYGADWSPPNEERLAAFVDSLERLAEDPLGMIAELRKLVENPADEQTGGKGGFR